MVSIFACVLRIYLGFQIDPDGIPRLFKNIDHCMGGGHIFVYAFNVLMQIYRVAGYAERDAAKLILVKNVFVHDIDHRAYHHSICVI